MLLNHNFLYYSVFFSPLDWKLQSWMTATLNLEECMLFCIRCIEETATTKLHAAAHGICLNLPATIRNEKMVQNIVN